MDVGIVVTKKLVHVIVAVMHIMLLLLLLNGMISGTHPIRVDRQSHVPAAAVASMSQTSQPLSTPNPGCSLVAELY